MRMRDTDLELLFTVVKSKLLFIRKLQKIEYFFFIYPPLSLSYPLKFVIHFTTFVWFWWCWNSDLFFSSFVFLRNLLRLLKYERWMYILNSTIMIYFIERNLSIYSCMKKGRYFYSMKTPKLIQRVLFTKCNCEKPILILIYRGYYVQMLYMTFSTCLGWLPKTVC